MKHPLFHISNHHVNGGVPLKITSDQPLRYRGYFENSLGRQWVLAVDLNGEVKLRSGDIDWTQEIIVSNIDETVRDESLQPDEELWLRSCWAALFPEWKRGDCRSSIGRPASLWPGSGDGRVSLCQNR